MTEIKTWKDRLHGEHKTEDLPNLLLTNMQAEINDLRAELERLEAALKERGEPACWRVWLTDRWVYSDDAHMTEECQPLYTHPAQPREPMIPTDAMVDAYLKAQRETVEEADRVWGRPNVGGLHTNTVRNACCNGLKAAIKAFHHIGEKSE